MRTSHGIHGVLALVAMLAVPGTALAQVPGYWQGGWGGPAHGPAMGHGMMGGYEAGPGYGPGYGMGAGPGMMGGYGPGPGYGPGAGMGGGMMPGMGRGMMGGQTYGPGRGGQGMTQGTPDERLHALDLNEDQRRKIAGIMEDTRRKNWDMLGQIRAERFKLREMFYGDKVDPAAVTEQQRKLDELKRHVMRARLEARNQVFALLTPEQRQKAHSFGPPRWARDASR